jgi:hypothetical protein
VATYSFQDVMASITGPNGTANVGAGSCATEGGLTITMVEDKSTMVIGADGCVMHNLHAGKGANITIRLLKTSPMNRVLSMMYKGDTEFSGVHGQNVISIRDLQRNDVITAQQVAFGKFADVTYSKDAAEMSWVFHAGIVDFDLGQGLAVNAGVI